MEANTSSGMGGPGGEGGFPGEPPQMGNEQNRGDRPPMGGGPNGGQVNQGYSWETILTLHGYVVVLIAITVFAFLFKRRHT